MGLSGVVIKKGDHIFNQSMPWAGKVYTVSKDKISVKLNNGNYKFIDKKDIGYNGKALFVKEALT